MTDKTFKIAMIIAPQGFQDIEFRIPYNYFIDNGANVDVYSTKKGIAKGVFGSIYVVEHSIDELKVGDYDAVTFVGGTGTTIVRSDKDGVRVPKEAFDSGKIIGAICWSPTILAKAGILDGKKATVWHGRDDEFGMLTSEYLESKGAKYTGEDVTVDGKIITANGPSVAQKYAVQVWKVLNG